jgi:hypothetical protein
MPSAPPPNWFQNETSAAQCALTAKRHSETSSWRNLADVPVVTGDPEFRVLEGPIDVIWI